MKGTNQRSVQRRMCGAQTPDSKIMLLIRRSQPERERKSVPLCQEDAFFLLRMCHPFFLSRTSGSFCKFKFSFFLIQFNFFYLFIRSLQQFEEQNELIQLFARSQKRKFATVKVSLILCD